MNVDKKNLPIYISVILSLITFFSIWQFGGITLPAVQILLQVVFGLWMLSFLLLWSMPQLRKGIPPSAITNAFIIYLGVIFISLSRFKSEIAEGDIDISMIGVGLALIAIGIGLTAQRKEQKSEDKDSVGNSTVQALDKRKSLFNAQMRNIVVFGLLIVILSLGLAIGVYVLKTPTNFGYQPNNWDLIYDFLDKWASAGAPAITLFAVAVALGIGVANIIQTKSIQTNEYKQKLLGEIIDWAIGIVKCESEPEVPILPTIELQSAEMGQAKAAVQHINAVAIANLARRYQALDGRSKFIESIAKKLDRKFGVNSEALVNSVANKLDEHVGMLYKRVNNEIPEQECKEHWKSLVDSASGLADKVAELIEA